MGGRERVSELRSWLERLLLWRVWERMLELEFVDRGVALAGKAFVSFFPLTIVVAAFLPEAMRESIVKAITVRFGLQGDALDLVQQSFASSEDLKKATGLFGLTLTVLFATSFTTALQRVYLPRLAPAAPRRARHVLARTAVPRPSAGRHGAPRCGRPEPRRGRRGHHGRASWPWPRRQAPGCSSRGSSSGETCGSGSSCRRAWRPA